MQSFKMFYRFILISLALLGLSVSSAHAVLINSLTSSDWLAAGDEKLTNDLYGLQWLDLKETLNLSYSTVISELGKGGKFYGFRYATGDEVEGLWDSAGGDSDFYDGWSVENNGLFDNLAPFWGDTFCLSQFGPCKAGDGYSYAIHDTELNPGERYVALSYDHPGSLAPDHDYFHRYPSIA